LVHISEKIVYFASYFRQDCVFHFIFQTRLCILLHISDNIVYFASYFRQDCVFSFIFQTRLCIFLHISEKIVYFPSFSDKIVYFPSYFRQDCVFGVCPVDYNCDAGYTYCHWCIFDLHEKWVKYQIIYLCTQCLYVYIITALVSSRQPCVIKFISGLYQEQCL
jgi:hypothetical protein